MPSHSRKREPSSWLNSSRGHTHEQTEPCPELAGGIAETGFSVLARACLRGHKADEEALQKNISACAAERNAARASIRAIAS